MAPLLSQVLRRIGTTYRVAPVQWGKYILSVECTVRDAQGYTLRLGCTVERASEDGAALDALSP